MVGGSGFMHTEIFNQIDLLVSMAGSTLDTSEIESELIHINKDIQDKKQSVQDLKSMMNDTRYFNASNELVDRNIEVSLKSKLARLNQKIKDLQLKLNQIKKEESKLHDDISSLKANIEENEKYIHTLETKTTDNSSYQEILQSEKNHLNHLTEELKHKDERYQKVLKDLDLNEQALDELSTKKTSFETQLKEVTDNLNNPNAYIDDDLKKHDEERLNSLNESLEELQQKKLEYLTDPNMIGADAKELVVNGDYTEALNKIKELLSIVKSKPFMDITNLSILDEELEKKENERAELASVIDSKNYSGMNSDAASKRITYLNQEIAKEQNEVNRYQESSKQIDQEIVTNLSNLIRSLEADINHITSEIEEYQHLLEDSSKTRKTKANLESAILKKSKEKEVMENILHNYKKDLLFQINVSNTLLKIIQKFQKNISEYQHEVADLEHVSMLDEVSKDFVQEEQDKEKLRSINEEIKQIKNRKKFDKTPDEIYDQIEMLLANLNVPVKSTQEKKEVPSDLEIDDLFGNVVAEQPRIKVVNMFPVETVQSDATSGGVTYGA